MGRYAKGKPEGSTEIKTYEELEELLSNFVQGKIGLLAIVGPPGLSKSQSIKRALAGTKPPAKKTKPTKRRKPRPPKQTVDGVAAVVKKPKTDKPVKGKIPCLYIKGRKSAIDLYCDLYIHMDEPVIIDDCDDLMTNKGTLGIVKDLCELDRDKRMYWGTSTKILDKRGVPKQFTTRSHACIITNHWGSDAIYKALESRAEFVYFNPDWGTVYQKASEWFWDQEIFDYVHSKMEFLKQPDMRIFVKAAARKEAGMAELHWKKLIDEYCDDLPGMIIRQIKDDPSFPNEAAREDYFTKQTGHDRTTYYRRKKEIESVQPKSKPKRIVLPNAR